MSEMTGKNRTQLPEELLKQVTGGLDLNRLTAEENAYMNMVAQNHAAAYCAGNEEEIQKYADLINEFFDKLLAKYGE